MGFSPSVLNTWAAAARCPFHSGAQTRAAGATRSNADWWPNQLNVRLLHQHSAKSDPMEPGFDYARAFAGLDLDAVVADLKALMTDSLAEQVSGDVST